MFFFLFLIMACKCFGKALEHLMHIFIVYATADFIYFMRLQCQPLDTHTTCFFLFCFRTRSFLLLNCFCKDICVLRQLKMNASYIFQRRSLKEFCTAFCIMLEQTQPSCKTWQFKCIYCIQRKSWFTKKLVIKKADAYCQCLSFFHSLFPNQWRQRVWVCAAVTHDGQL